MKCPKCSSSNIISQTSGIKTGGSIGATTGFVCGLGSLTEGAKAGMAIGSFVGPAGRVAGAIIGGLTGAVAGLAVGCEIGDMVDEKIIGRHECLSCGYTFNQT